jgi:hypothetical protein
MKSNVEKSGGICHEGCHEQWKTREGLSRVVFQLEALTAWRKPFRGPDFLLRPEKQIYVLAHALQAWYAQICAI